MNIKLTREEKKISLLNSKDVFGVMQKILLRENKIDRDKEHFWIIGLNIKNKILFIELVAMGSVKSATVEPMNVFRVAVLKGATKVVLTHNHPSGEVDPSSEDEKLTDRLIQVGRILAIEVIEHLIISTRTYLSFADTGLMKKLSESTAWVPKYELIERIKKEEERIRNDAIQAAREKGERKGERKGHRKGKSEGLKIGVAKGEKKGLKAGESRGVKKGRKEGEVKGKAEGKKEEKIEIAKKMLSDGVDKNSIADYTGLSKAQITKLAKTKPNKKST